MRGFLKALAAIVVVGTLAGCVVAPGPGGGGWCYHHPYRC
jgi:hypothetical protein